MQVLKFKFGASGDRVDAFGIRFFGDFDGRVGHGGTFSEILTDPDIPPMTTHQRVTLWFMFEKIRPYDKVARMLDHLTEGLKKRGYTIKLSSLDGLVDTTSPEYDSKPERRFPASRRMHGCNAATGFSVTAEKTDAKLKFSSKEISSVKEVAVQLGQEIYGRPLKMVSLQS
ncbi:MAG TPA: hypothetical protein PLE15_06605 [Smithellaceae bacterium]|jgi:hypothetical protein|nr:hypothetical protein [Smithellaceae bacterium]HOR61660.1 hypothetical protein [Smithellaceae bacterium]HPL32313.1 hypothetical protein [Smithellaceae bacterium]HQK91796.1 hypothetical protein [Smithellaceae bacterium]